MSIETMKLALEALQKIYIAPEHEEYIRVWWPACEEAIPVLRQAIEQAQQAEPVAYGTWDTMLGKGNRMMMVRLDKGQDGCTVPLYTAPPPRQPWVGLTDEERFKLAFQTGAMTADWLPFMKAVEAKLKAKNL